MQQVAEFVYIFLTVYMLCMFIWALVGWLPMVSPGLAFNGAVRSTRSFLDSIILPYVRLFSFVKPVQMGGMMFDMSFLLAFFTLLIAQRVIPPILAG